MRPGKENASRKHSMRMGEKRAMGKKALREAQGNFERAEMEANQKTIRVFSGLYGNETYVQNVWVSLPVRMTREEFKDRLRKGFNDVGKI